MLYGDGKYDRSKDCRAARCRSLSMVGRPSGWRLLGHNAPGQAGPFARQRFKELASAAADAFGEAPPDAG
jgi:hypothetical protein